MATLDTLDMGWCNACGEEAPLYGPEHCPDGEVVPYDDDTEAR